MAELLISAEAERDLVEAYAWYENCRSGLGEEFLSCVDARLRAIERLPELHEKVYQDYRRAIVRRFPYVIFYEYSGDTVTVFGVFHASRRPETWQKRLDS